MEKLLSKKYSFLIVALLIGLWGLIIYSNTIFYEFQFDDESLILQNVKITSSAYFNSMDHWLDAESRTLSLFSFYLNYLADDYNPVGYHLINILIHIIASLGIYYLAKTLFGVYYKKYRLSGLIAALLFLTHPVQTESVAYIAQRMTALSGLFLIWGMYFYLKGRLKHNFFNKPTLYYSYYFLSLIFGFLSVSAKQTGLLFPLFYLLLEIFIINHYKKGNQKIWTKYFIGIILIFYIFLISFGNYYYGEYQSIPWSDYLYTQFRVIVKYIQLLFIPVQQNIDYDFPLSHIFWEWNVLYSILFISGLLFIGVKYFITNRLLSFAIFFFFLSITLESGIFPLPDVIFEHRLYIAVFAFSIFCINFFNEIKTKSYVRKLPSYIILMIIILINSGFTYYRNRVWKSPVTLWTDSMKKSPTKARVVSNLGYAYFMENNYDQALLFFHKAIALDKNYVDAYNNIGRIYFKNEEYKNAMIYFRKAYDINPQYVYSLYNIGLILNKLDKDMSAKKCYYLCIKTDPYFFPAYFDLANIHEEHQQYKKAIDLYKKVLVLRPVHYKAYFNTGNCYFNLGDFDKAIFFYNKAIRLNPNFANSYNNIGNIYFLKNNFSAAKSYYMKCLSIDPEHKAAKQNLKKVNNIQ